MATEQLLVRIRLGLKVAAMIAATGVMMSGCGQDNKQAAETTPEKPDALAGCLYQTGHELDGDSAYRDFSFIDLKVVAQCEQAVAEHPESVVAIEHLARAYMAAATAPQGGQWVDKGVDALVKAARMNSPWAMVQAAGLNVPGIDKTAVEQQLRSIVESRPSAGATLLLAQTRSFEAGKLRDLKLLYREAIMRMFEDGANSGGARILVGMTHQMMALGKCGRRISPTVKVSYELEEDLDGEQFCGLLATLAADAGDPIANFDMGYFHFANAVNASKATSDREHWQARMTQAKLHARQRLNKVVELKSWVYGGAAQEMLSRIDDIQMGQSAGGTNFLAAIIGLVLMAPGGGSPAAREDTHGWDFEKNRCRDAQAYTFWNGDDGSAVDASMRAEAATCNPN